MDTENIIIVDFANTGNSGSERVWDNKRQTSYHMEGGKQSKASRAFHKSQKKSKGTKSKAKASTTKTSSRTNTQARKNQAQGRARRAAGKTSGQRNNRSGRATATTRRRK